MEEKLIVAWHVDDSNPEKPRYQLACEHPDYPLLEASVGKDEVTERAARAKLIAMVFEKARELGIDTSRLRFHV